MFLVIRSLLNLWIVLLCLFSSFYKNDNGTVFPEDQNYESPLDSLTQNFGGPLTLVPKILSVLFKFNYFHILMPFLFCDNTFDIKQFVLNSLLIQALLSTFTWRWNIIFQLISTVCKSHWYRFIFVIFLQKIIIYVKNHIQ